MRLPPVGWAFFGLVIILVAGYLLNRGLYVGSSTTVDGTFDDGSPEYRKICAYLYLNGTRSERGLINRTEEGADFFCAPLHPG